MCGIAGVLYSDSARPVERSLLQAMGDSISHRGPDAEGYWIEPGIGLVHRRLSIIDLNGGDQPIGNEDGSVQVVLNGEIYNYRELRAQLESRGHRFRTCSDTEVIVHLYEERAEQLVDELRGMFAFALWDRRTRRLMLARDRVGIKPMYLYRDSEKLIFGSELKAILAHPGVERAIDVAGLEDYLTFGVIPGARSIFRNVEKLPPAHIVVATAESLNRSPSRYWQLQFEPDERPTAEQWIEAVQGAVAESVQLHLVADVPVGAFLSGGLDSSVIVASCADRTADPLQTFSIGFREETFSELPFARAVSDQFGTRHVEEVITPDATTLLDELTLYFDEPFADSSAIPTFHVARLARRSVKVALSGDGGDEAFGGYARYAHDLKEAAVRRCLPRWFRRLAISPLARCWPKADWLPRQMRAKTALTNLSLDGGAAYANTLAIFRQPLRRSLLAPDLATHLNGHDPGQIIRESHGQAPTEDPLAGMIAADMATLLPDDFLVKVDRASMANGLEVRPPFLDHKLLELAARIPSRFKIRAGDKKWILKQSFGRQLPASAVSRRKQGFELPIDAWLRGPLRGMLEASVLDPGARVAGLINPTIARQLFHAHMKGSGRHGNELWTLLVLARWADRYLGPTTIGGPVAGARSELGAKRMAIGQA
jgi:asparagine synthase (glutamine-hydrolysing)